MLRLKNITDKNFSFEGTNIPARGISEELTSEIHGRLLALNAGRTLINYEEPTEIQGSQEVTGKVSNETPVQGESQALQDFLKVKEKEVEKFLCQCGKEFISARALKGHKVGAKHN